MSDQVVIPVILCGGAGTRLWPVSREKMPKQFVPLIGTSSTFQQVLDRVTREGLFAPPMIITNSEFRFVVAEQARARGVKATIILELRCSVRRSHAPNSRDAAVPRRGRCVPRRSRHPAQVGGRNGHRRWCAHRSGG
jgi:mannose-1-phosphate guanylyltransferase / mannose-6-phosphate isomerase